LVKAKNLALSKFNCLPVITSASNSAAIDDSISNKLPAISLTCCKLKPSWFALITAAPISFTELPNDTAISLDTLAVSSNIFCWLNALGTDWVKASKEFSKLVPVIVESLARLPEASALKPIALVISLAVISVSCVNANWTFTPSCSVNAAWVFNKSTVVTRLVLNTLKPSGSFPVCLTIAVLASLSAPKFLISKAIPAIARVTPLVTASAPAVKDFCNCSATLSPFPPSEIDFSVAASKSDCASVAILLKPGIAPSICKNWLAGFTLSSASSLNLLFFLILYYLILKKVILVLVPKVILIFYQIEYLNF